MNYSKEEVLQFVTENDVKFVKLMFTDVFGNTKTISIMPDELPLAFENGIPFDASKDKGLLSATESDICLIPDPTTLAILPWRPQKGRVVRLYCNLFYPDKTPFEGDTRKILQDTAKECSQMGYVCKIGTECEFYLFELDDKGQPTTNPHDYAGYFDVAPMDKGENVRRDICLTLEEMGIKPETSHHEMGPGQHEIDFKYSTLVEASDNLATFKMVVKTISQRNGLAASFHPKPLSDKNGSGLHINISLLKDNENIFKPIETNENQLSDEASYFMAGILHRIKDITAFLNPTINSYQRFGSNEAPFLISWSKHNNSPLLRLPVASNENYRIELRSPDPTCNPYIALSLIIRAGLEGIKDKRKLCDPININLINANNEEKKGIDTLPKSLDLAKETAKQSSFIKAVLPEKLIQTMLG